MNRQPINPRTPEARSGGLRRARRRKDRLFQVLCWFAASMSLVILAVLLGSIFSQGGAHLDGDFLTSAPSRNADDAGIMPALWGTVWICAVCAATAIPLGVGTALFLEEFRPRHRAIVAIHQFVQVNIANLAGVPSVVYGLLGLTVFVQMFGFGNANDPSFAFGVQRYDMFVDAADNSVLVAVDDDDAPTVLDPALRFVDIEGEPIDVRIVDAGQIAPIRAEVEAAMSRFTALLREGLAGADPADRPTVEAALAAAADAIAWRADRADVVSAAMPELSGAESFEGRAGRRALRLAGNAVERHELRARLGGFVEAGSVPTRIDEKLWYYFQVPFGRGVLAGGLTLMLVVLPIVIVSAQEALRAVPGSLKKGSLALGATPWQTIWNMTLPAAVPGIMTGTILAMSRAIGEAAPILVLAGIVFILTAPHHLMDEFTAMPLQIYNWASRPQAEFHDVAASGIIVLLVVLLGFNALAVFIRYRFQRPLS